MSPKKKPAQVKRAEQTRRREANAKKAQSPALPKGIRKRPHAAVTPKKAHPSQQPRKQLTGGAHSGGRRVSTFGAWLEGARLRTLPLAIVPVLLGTGEAHASARPTEWQWLLALGCLAVALFLQIGVNYANDYSDGIRGTDDFRVGPPRLTGSGLAKPEHVKRAAFICFGIAAVVGLALVIATAHWWLLVVGAAAIAAAWFYTGGKHPYGYYGLGEVFVFIFFGLVATAGTLFIQRGVVTTNGWLLAVAAGLFSCAVLMVNNIRDIEQDRLARKRTLAVLIGDRAARISFAVMALAPFVVAAMFYITIPATVFSFGALLLIAPAVIITLMADESKDLVLALKLTSLGALVYALGIAIPLMLPTVY
nr:1,4-dihydroxy-2-naphthoate polyprenyltransferase [Pseudoclavibacter alba]